MPAWIVRFLEYFEATYGYWWGTLAMLTAAERFAERLFHGFWRKYIDPWITPEWRKYILLCFVIIAFVIGNFRAFDAEREAKELRCIEATATRPERHLSRWFRCSRNN
jgi:hypothetical protein